MEKNYKLLICYSIKHRENNVIEKAKIRPPSVISIFINNKEDGGGEMRSRQVEHGIPSIDPHLRKPSPLKQSLAKSRILIMEHKYPSPSFFVLFCFYAYLRLS